MERCSKFHPMLLLGDGWTSLLMRNRSVLDAQRAPIDVVNTLVNALKESLEA